MIQGPNQRIAAVGLIALAADQMTKLAVLKNLYYAEELVIIDGFFKLVHWGNTGAAWSLFRDRNNLLAVVSLLALLALFVSRHHFDVHTSLGQAALGLMFGGILGNLIDRMHVDHVIDFIRFYVHQRGGGEMGFPAFNFADVAICVGVGLLFLSSWRSDPAKAGSARSESQ